MIEVAFVNGDRVMVTTMTFKESYFLKPNPNWHKWNYQIGKCAFTATEDFDKTKII